MDKLTTEEFEKLKLIEAKMGKMKPGKWQLFVEGRDHMGGDTVIVRENDDDLYINPGAGIEDWEFVANSKADIEFLIRLVNKLMKN